MQMQGKLEWMDYFCYIRRWKNCFEKLMVIKGKTWTQVHWIESLDPYPLNMEKWFLILSYTMLLHNLIYRTRATNSRSWLVTAPLCFQAKTHFLCAFYVVNWGSKNLFWIEAVANSGASTVYIFCISCCIHFWFFE